MSSSRGHSWEPLKVAISPAWYTYCHAGILDVSGISDDYPLNIVTLTWLRRHAQEIFVVLLNWSLLTSNCQHSCIWTYLHGRHRESRRLEMDLYYRRRGLLA